MQHYQKDSAHVDFPSVSSCTWVALVDVQEAYCSSNGSFKFSNDVYYCPLDYPDDRRKERECKVGTVRYWYEGHFRRQTGMRCNLQSRKRTQQAPFHLISAGNDCTQSVLLCLDSWSSLWAMCHGLVSLEPCHLVLGEP